MPYNAVSILATIGAKNATLETNVFDGREVKWVSIPARGNHSFGLASGALASLLSVTLPEADPSPKKITSTVRSSLFC
jgi:hypothetical protein